MRQRRKFSFLRIGRHRSRSSSTGAALQDNPLSRDNSPGGQPDSQTESSAKRNVPIPELILDTSEPTVTDVELRGRSRQQGHVDATEGQSQSGKTSRSLNSNSSNSDFPGKLDLTVIHSPGSRNLDIIFVHGLGGGSRKTWCYDKNPGIFWPEWLPQLATLSRARISTFGYNAEIFGSKGSADANVESFAKQLLHCLTIHGQGHEKFGKVPTIFICHSMGGLVVKRACVKAAADRDSSMRLLSSCISGIIFLGTPHRGSPQAKKLNSMRYLFGQAGDKAYIKDLTINSSLLQMLNDDFRHLTDRIRLFSFWEQKKTALGTFELMIVEQPSATLGYSEEGSAPLLADHHLICKFSSSVDPNYVTVTSTLVAMVEKILENVRTTTPGDRLQHVEEVYQLLLTPDLASTEADFYAIRGKRLEGSCRWITKQPWFNSWEQDRMESTSKILWLNGAPGTGKSVISTFIIDHIRQSGYSCYYYFFKSSDVSKRSLERCLLTIAYHISLAEQDVRDKFRQLYRSHFHLLGAELQLLWQRVFISGILPIYEHQASPLFLVVDALDEAENSKAIFPLLESLRHIPFLRLCVTSRPSIEFAQQLSLLENKVQISAYTITQKDNIADITSLITTVLSSLPLVKDVRAHIVESVIQKSEGNILWVSLVTQQMLKAGFNEEHLLQVLKRVPPGMDEIYADILTKMKAFPPKQREIAKWIILWTLSSFQPLKIHELQEALQFQPPAEKVEVLEYWVAELCGSFLVVDREKSVQPIHTTAREFLLADRTTDYAITTEAHLHIAKACIKSILQANTTSFVCNRSIVRGPKPFQSPAHAASMQTYPLWGYSVFWWSDHLVHANSKDPETFDLVTLSLKSPTFIDCIRMIAEAGDLRPLIRIAYNLKQYLSILEISEINAKKGDVKLISLWTVDLIRLTTEFGQNLLKFPSLIETIIAPFCPRSTAIYSNYGARGRGILLLGDVPRRWDTRLACLNIPKASPSAATTVCAASKLVAVGYQDGMITVWNSTTALLVHELDLTEPVNCLTFNHAGSIIAAGGRESIKLWNASTAIENLSLSIVDVPVLLAFSSDDFFLFAILRNNTISVYKVEDGSILTQFNWAEEKQWAHVVAEFPIHVSLNLHRTRIALAYRGLPVSLWDIERKVYLKKLRSACPTASSRQVYEPGQRGPTSCAHDSATAVEFHSVTNEIFISYGDRRFMKWDPDTNVQVVAPMHADIHVLKCSPDGTVVVTGNSGGQINLWTTTTLELVFTLEEDDEAVRRLCFSPNGNRIFDVRGTYCNVWEPEILLKGTKVYRETRTPSLIPSGEPSGMMITNSMSVTCLCPSPNGAFSIAGTDNGRVILYSLVTGQRLRVLYNHSSSAEITSMTWSNDSRLIATGDSTSKVFVYSLAITHGSTDIATEQQEQCEDEVESDDNHIQVFESALDISVLQVLKGYVKVAGRFDGPIMSLIIHENNGMLLASTRNADSVWRLSLTPQAPPKKSSRPVGSNLTICYSAEQSRQLLRHPTDIESVIIVDSMSMRVRSWPLIKNNIASCSNRPNSDVSIDSNLLGDQVFLTTIHTDGEQQDWELKRACISGSIGDSVLVTCINPVRVAQGGRQREIWVWKFDLSQESGNMHPIMRLGTSVTSTTIQSLLGVFDQRLYFLDIRGWVCSKDIELKGPDSRTPDRDDFESFDMWFFLPRGQVTSEMSSTISLAVVSKKDMIFTRKEKVIVVKRGLWGQGRRVTG